MGDVIMFKNRKLFKTFISDVRNHNLSMNDISEKLQVVSSEKARSLIYQGEKVLSPRINVKTEKWDGGHTYISISFYDYDTNQSVAVVKSSGIGMTISHDQKLAYKALKKELDKTFK